MTACQLSSFAAPPPPPLRDLSQKSQAAWDDERGRVEAHARPPPAVPERPDPLRCERLILASSYFTPQIVPVTSGVQRAISDVLNTASKNGPWMVMVPVAPANRPVPAVI